MDSMQHSSCNLICKIRRQRRFTLLVYILFQTCEQIGRVSISCSFRTMLMAGSRLQSITSSSSGSSSDSGSPLGRPIPLHCSAKDICELTFSESNILYVVSKPRDTRSIQENALTVFAWNIIDGRRLALQPVIISHKVSGIGTSLFPF